ncbi:hypothetical protein BU26DRAFT_569230 [Trematosphaeria pertusa]|uniref:Uncharacterized protein n=1 Tax=Trematosphaeria pertusa TaxID=390896 RepID=A0A6A6I1M9_9PLEO|nr:uncharacterized protein BU26DRAFT_569230 [Trematosphaeria pertusa]KAF2244231.1 hypothetical protein BU26DRAFT_569230 [Trematosphaeria pertusa]
MGLPYKRSTPGTGTDDNISVAASTPERAAKRQKLGDPNAGYALLRHYGPATPLLTPPPSALPAPGRLYPAVSLTVKIPQHIPDKKEKQTLAARKAAATRWANSGKLTRPYPTNRELNMAYKLKLVRHYPASPGTVPESNFVRPQISKSSRVTNLLRSFPKHLSNLVVPAPTQQRYMNQSILNRNKEITASEDAVRLAWESFAVPDRPTRHAMMESGLKTEELYKEDRGLPNALPEWKKHRTSRFRAQRVGGAGKRLR